MNIEWKVLDSITHDNGVILDALYGCFAREGRFMQEVLNTASFTPDLGNLIPFDQVDKDTILGWVFGVLGEQGKTDIEAQAAAKLQAEMDQYA